MKPNQSISPRLTAGFSVLWAEQGRPVYVVTCDRRPVPLNHLLYNGPADDLQNDQLLPRRTFEVLDHNGIFSDEKWVTTSGSSTGHDIHSVHTAGATFGAVYFLLSLLT